MRIAFRAKHKKWGDSVNIYETEFVCCDQESKTIRFSVKGRHNVCFYIFVKDSSEYEQAKVNLFSEGMYSFLNHKVEMLVDGNEPEWVCIYDPDKETNT